MDQVSPKLVQFGAKVDPNGYEVGPKLVPRWTPIVQVWTKLEPSWPKLAQIGPKFAPRWPKMAPS